MATRFSVENSLQRAQGKSRFAKPDLGSFALQYATGLVLLRLLWERLIRVVLGKQIFKNHCLFEVQRRGQRHR
jgi:hypothetical protein